MRGTKRCHEELAGTTVLMERKLYQERPLTLDVSDSSNFRVQFKIVKDGLEPESGDSQHRCILMGIVPNRVANDNFALVEGTHPKHGFFITDYGNLWAQDGTDCDSEIHNLPIGAVLRLHYISEPSPVLLASTDDQKPTVLNFKRSIPADDYKPCVVFRTGGTAVEVTVSDPAKRPSSPQCKMLSRMWESRAFTDAEISCEGRAFPIHREVLAAASPVFAAAFGGSMREATTAKIEIVDATANAVKAFLQNIYTESLEPADAVAVLPLAHRYQVEGLVRRCGEELLRNLTAESVARVVEVLRTLKEDKLVAPVWDALLGKLMADRGLMKATLD